MCLSLFLQFSLCTDDSCTHVSVAAHGGLGSGGFSMITSLKDTPGLHHYGFQAGETINISLLIVIFHMHHGKWKQTKICTNQNSASQNVKRAWCPDQPPVCLKILKGVSHMIWIISLFCVCCLVLQSPEYLEKMRWESLLPSSRMILQSCHPILTPLKRSFPLKRARLSRYDSVEFKWDFHTCIGL